MAQLGNKYKQDNKLLSYDLTGLKYKIDWKYLLLDSDFYVNLWRMCGVWYAVCGVWYVVGRVGRVGMVLRCQMMMNNLWLEAKIPAGVIATAIHWHSSHTPSLSSGLFILHFSCPLCWKILPGTFVFLMIYNLIKEIVKYRMSLFLFPKHSRGANYTNYFPVFH